MRIREDEMPAKQVTEASSRSRMSQQSRASTVDFGSDNTDLAEDPDQADPTVESDRPQLTPPLFDVFDEGAWTSAVEVRDASVSQCSTVQQSSSEAEDAASLLSPEELTLIQASRPKPAIRRPWEDSPYGKLHRLRLNFNV